MTAQNLHAKATWRAYRQAAAWLEEHHPEVWDEIHQTERRRLGLGPVPQFGPRSLARRQREVAR